MILRGTGGRRNALGWRTRLAGVAGLTRRVGATRTRGAGRGAGVALTAGRRGVRRRRLGAPVDRRVAVRAADGPGVGADGLPEFAALDVGARHPAEHLGDLAPDLLGGATPRGDDAVGGSEERLGGGRVPRAPKGLGGVPKRALDV